MSDFPEHTDLEPCFCEECQRTRQQEGINLFRAALLGMFLSAVIVGTMIFVVWALW